MRRACARVAAEVELRALALHAVGMMVAGLRAEGVTIRAQQLDLLLWRRGRSERYRRVPRQRTRTTFYGRWSNRTG